MSGTPATARPMAMDKQQPLLFYPAAAAGSGMRRHRYLTFLAIAAALVASYHILHAPTPSSRYHALFLSLGSNATAAAHLRELTTPKPKP